MKAPQFTKFLLHENKVIIYSICFSLTISAHTMSSTISSSAVYRFTFPPVPRVIASTPTIGTLLNIMDTQDSGDIPWTLEQWIRTINMTIGSNNNNIIILKSRIDCYSTK